MNNFKQSETLHKRISESYDNYYYITLTHLHSNNLIFPDNNSIKTIFAWLIQNPPVINNKFCKICKKYYFDLIKLILQTNSPQNCDCHNTTTTNTTTTDTTTIDTTTIDTTIDTTINTTTNATTDTTTNATNDILIGPCLNKNCQIQDTQIKLISTCNNINNCIFNILNYYSELFFSYNIDITHFYRYLKNYNKILVDEVCSCCTELFMRIINIINVLNVLKEDYKECICPLLNWPLFRRTCFNKKCLKHDCYTKDHYFNKLYHHDCKFS